MSPKEILNVLAHGQPMLHRLQFAEGLTMREVAQAVAATDATTAERFLDRLPRPRFSGSDCVNATDAEGYLFRNLFSAHPQAGPLPHPLLPLDRFADTVQDLPQARDPKALHDTAILASLVEKETAAPAERGTVAGVYANRLEQGMLLQCDLNRSSTAWAKPSDGNLKRFHLTDAANLYNTYVHPGLPARPHLLAGQGPFP